MSSMTSTQSGRPATRSSATPSSENTRARDSGMINLFLKAYFVISVWINWRGPTTIISYLTKIQSWSRAGSSTRSTGASQQPSAERSANSLRLDGRTIHFSINAWVWNDYLLKQSSYVWSSRCKQELQFIMLNAAFTLVISLLSPFIIISFQWLWAALIFWLLTTNVGIDLFLF